MDSKTTSDDRSKECNDASDVADEVASVAVNLGGEVVIHVPPIVAKTLDIEIGDAVTIEMQDGRAVLRPDEKAEGRR
jgi:bifunctional DNA-binding transcriptional regulator/antitoxin component of YhaV-PrlF toxin-antitoxin module